MASDGIHALAFVAFIMCIIRLNGWFAINTIQSRKEREGGRWRRRPRDKNTPPIYKSRNSNPGGMTHRSNPLTDQRIQASLFSFFLFLIFYSYCSFIRSMTLALRRSHIGVEMHDYISHFSAERNLKLNKNMKCLFLINFLFSAQHQKSSSVDVSPLNCLSSSSAILFYLLTQLFWTKVETLREVGQ